MYQLPKEIWNEVLSYIDYNTFARLQSVSSTFYLYCIYDSNKRVVWNGCYASENTGLIETNAIALTNIVIDGLYIKFNFKHHFHIYSIKCGNNKITFKMYDVEIGNPKTLNEAVSLIGDCSEPLQNAFCKLLNKYIEIYELKMISVYNLIDECCRRNYI